jgi:hypothetical protein
MTSSNILVPENKVIKPEDISLEDLNYLSKDNFALWSLTSGAKVDSNDVDFQKHRYLYPIYCDNSTEIVWMKSAQMGATVYMLLRTLWWLYQHQGRKACLYLPNAELSQNTSKDRLAPLIESIPPIARMMAVDDKLGLRKIGTSSFYLFHLGGVSSKDSVPLDYVSFDEVRLCKDKDIDQALERISHSIYKYKVFMSTAGMPESSIHRRYILGTQHVWQSACGCTSGSGWGCDLARAFPDCVVADDPRRPIPYLRCPKCKFEIKDPQNGKYIPHNPGAGYNSYHVSQLASKFISIPEIWDFWKRTTNISEFYNSKLGLPYVDEENRGVSMTQLEACVDPHLEWAKPKKMENHTAMGVDQGGGYCYVTIADNKDGKKRIRHLEIIEQHNPQYKEAGQLQSPFKRLTQLMNEYNVKLCVVDAMPNINDAIQFAQQFPGRVFLAYYNKDAKDIVQWGDKKKYKEVLRKAGPLLKFKYLCILNRFSSLDFAFGEWAGGNVVCPDPDKLAQMCFDEQTGQLAPESSCRRMFSHLVRMVKNYREINPETGEGKWEFIFGGQDPHFCHSWNYCNAALERLKKTTLFTFA